MNIRNKQKKRQQEKIIIMDKYQQEPIELLNKYFPKGKTKYRGEAMCLLAVSFLNGFKAGEEYSYKKKKVQKK